MLGTREGDPNGSGQGAFEPSSTWMPPFMRVNPVLLLEAEDGFLPPNQRSRDTYSAVCRCILLHSLYSHPSYSRGALKTRHKTVLPALMLARTHHAAQIPHHPRDRIHTGFDTLEVWDLTP